MSGKVKVSREVAEAIEYLLNHPFYGYTKTKLLKVHAEMENYKQRNWSDGPAKILNDISLLDLAKILVNDYEIEQTPEEKIVAEYNRLKDLRKKTKDPLMVESCNSSMFSIAFTLNKLNIQIEGINK